MTTTEAPDLKSLQMMYRLQLTRAIVLQQLMTSRVTTAEDLIAAGAAPTVQSVRAVVHHLRKFLAKKKIKLDTQYGVGYFISEASKKEINQQLTDYLAR